MFPQTFPQSFSVQKDVQWLSGPARTRDAISGLKRFRKIMKMKMGKGRDVRRKRKKWGETRMTSPFQPISLTHSPILY